MLIKVCGLNNRDNIITISKMDIQLMGFIFYKGSPRYFNNALSFNEVRQIPKTIKKVGVFVNEPVYSILNTVAHFDLDMVQLHGEEPVKDCEQLLPFVKVIKTISIKDKASLKSLSNYTSVCDHFLFDTATANYGGSGNSFNWNLLQEIKITKPFFISGGISPNNYNELAGLKLNNFIGIDVNSKFEVTPGLKDIEKINLLLKQKHHASANH
ncbi:MAG: phosphoribosylanthranilate isomerase [Bacteroidetes bacterium]|nr:phosphoribosylanthranilate isomerase [Bacteroidota bacterium]